VLEHGRENLPLGCRARQVDLVGLEILDHPVLPGPVGLLLADAGDIDAQGKEEIGAGRLVTTFSKPHFLEILHPEVNKGNGLRHLANHVGIAIDETIAVGDNLNDLEMLRAAGLGIAVANAHDRLKAVADVVLSRSAGDGAIEEIEERFF